MMSRDPQGSGAAAEIRDLRRLGPGSQAMPAGAGVTTVVRLRAREHPAGAP